ncbi:hypothetical protein B7P43_G02172 [Cryptotermes secundus]|nr:hypothetical protein B7P43_G02172 [Cryptotermes secundus]
MGNTEEDTPSSPLTNVANIHLPHREELDSLTPQQASCHLQKLLELQKQLSAQQIQLQQQMQEVRLKMNKVQQLPISSIPVQAAQSAKNIETVTVLAPADANDSGGELVTRSGAQQVLHILELPTSSPSVITENVHPQPTISLMASNGDFEPLTNISVNLQGRGQTTFSNIVILPESALAANTTTQGTSVINYSPPTEATDNTVPAVSSRNLQTGGMVESIPFTTKTSSPAVSTFQLYGVMDTTTPNLLHFNY